MSYIPIAVFSLVLGAAMCAPEHFQGNREHSSEHADELEQADAHAVQLAKRSPHYDFGLGKRAYSYVSEYKRLPVYNFGLGKRSSPYSFGLGKRSIEEDSEPIEEDFNNNEIDQEVLTDLIDQYDDAPGYEKRARPYSFGLGKRSNDDDVKRAKMYDFGLGKRVPLYNFGLGKRARTYSFGLGKRLNKQFNFGLGKRERDSRRFNFGLGKRSASDIDGSDDSEV